MKKYVALLLVLIFALSFMSAVAFAEGEVKSPEGIDPAPVDKPVVSPYRRQSVPHRRAGAHRLRC